MKTILAILSLVIVSYLWVVPYLIRVISDTFADENANLLSNMQNLDTKYNKGVVRGKNGRFMAKDENNA
jgi:hypothetical protein